MTAAYLIAGLLGSGKTTLLRRLITRKPPHEKWALLINDFGPLSIDDLLLDRHALPLETVRGGCLCCSARAGFRQALDRLRQRFPADRLFIEPTGLGHPAEIIDLLERQSDIVLRHVLALFSPLQLTPERWKRSELMQALATLSQTIVLNHIDQADPKAIQQARELLHRLHRPPFALYETIHGNIPLPAVLTPPPSPPPFQWQNMPASHRCAPAQPKKTTLPDALACFQQRDDALYGISWQFAPAALFSRPCLKRLFDDRPPLRAKGLIRTGRTWQQLQFAENALRLTPFAWRQDSRLVAFFETEQAIERFEKRLAQCIMHRPQ